MLKATSARPPGPVVAFVIANAPRYFKSACANIGVEQRLADTVGFTWLGIPMAAPPAGALAERMPA